MAGHPSDSLFKRLDTDRDSVIRVQARRAVVLSAQYAASHVWTKGDGEMTLEIVAPQQFRKVK